jgi:hypothetical protein
MSSFRRGRDLIAALVVSAVIWPTSLFAQSQPSASNDQSSRISITYVPPETSALQDIYDLLREHRALERMQEILSPFRSPEELTIKTAECTELDIEFIDSSEAPVGLGEPGTTVVAPAIGNAIFTAVGVRLRHLPIRRAAVLEALTSQRTGH